MYLFNFYVLKFLFLQIRIKHPDEKSLSNGVVNFFKNMLIKLTV